MTLALLLTCLGIYFCAPSCLGEGLYSKNSAVLQVSGKNFDDLIKNADKPSIVEFYAPWCGHCQNLKPAYEKAAKSLEGIANIAAVNCDDESNKAFCGGMGIRGFPTLKTVKTTLQIGKPIILDYQGGRTATEIAEAAKKLILNNVKRVEDKDRDEWFKENNETAKAILFSNKGTTSALIKTLANEYFNNMHFAQVRDKETETNQMFGVEKYPTLVVLPGGDKEAVLYEGEMQKPAMNEFLSGFAELRNVSPPGKKSAKKDKKEGKKEKEKSSSDASKLSEASASQATSEASESAASAKTITISAPDPSGSPEPIVGEEEPKPIVLSDGLLPLPLLNTKEDFQDKCLRPNSPTCVLALLPPKTEPDAAMSTKATAALAALSEIDVKHKSRGGHLFPFYAVQADNPQAEALKTALNLNPEELDLIAVSGKRSWWRHYDSSKGFGSIAVEGWVDGIRFGEGKKQKLPKGIVLEKEAETPSEELPTTDTPEVTKEEVKEEVEEVPKEEAEEEGKKDKPPIIHEDL